MCVVVLLSSVSSTISNMEIGGKESGVNIRSSVSPVLFLSTICWTVQRVMISVRFCSRAYCFVFYYTVYDE